MKDIETVVSDNIKKLMNEYEVNQVELSKIAGVSESTVGKWVLKKSAPRMGSIQKISDHFGIPKSYILDESKEVVVPASTTYGYIPVGVAAGLPEHVDSIMEQEVQQIHIPDVVMGKYASQQDIYFMKINGNSMNNVMPNGSLIAIKPTNLANLQDDDVVVYSDDYEYSTKRFINDTKNERFIFRPDSSDRSYSEHHIPYSNAANLKIHGKVVLHIVETD